MSSSSHTSESENQINSLFDIHVSQKLIIPVYLEDYQMLLDFSKETGCIFIHKFS